MIQCAQSLMDMIYQKGRLSRTCSVLKITTLQCEATLPLSPEIDTAMIITSCKKNEMDRTGRWIWSKEDG